MLQYGRAALEAVLKAVTGQAAPMIPPPQDYNGHFFQGVVLSYIGALTFFPYENTEPSKLSQRGLGLLLGTEKKIANSWPARPQPRPRGAFPWLWTTSKAREKRPGDVVGPSSVTIPETIAQDSFLLELSSCFQALGSSGRKRERARARETRERWWSACTEGPRKSFQLAFSSAFRAGAPSPLACLLLARAVFLVPTTSKRQLRRLFLFLKWLIAPLKPLSYYFYF